MEPPRERWRETLPNSTPNRISPRTPVRRRLPAARLVSALGVFVVTSIVLLAMARTVGTLGPTSSNLTVAKFPGDFISISCTGGTIYFGTTSVCANTNVGSYPVCGPGSTCTFNVKATMNSGYTFKDFASSGAFCFGSSGGTCNQGTTSNPTSAWAYCASSCGGSLDLNGKVIPPPPTCPSTSISGVTSALGIKEAWVNWTDSPANATDSFWYGTSPSNLNGGATFTGAHGVLMTGLSGQTTYYYKIYALTGFWCTPQTSATTTGSFFEQTVWSDAAPYSAGWNTTWTSASYGMTANAGATNNLPSGGAGLDGSVWSGGLGQAQAEGWAGFLSAGFHFAYGDTYTIAYSWKLSWSASMLTNSAIIIPGCGAASVEAQAESNFHDLSNGWWAKTGNVTNQFLNAQDPCIPSVTLPYSGSGYYNMTFSAVINHPGDLYQFFTVVDLYITCNAAGAGTGQASFSMGAGSSGGGTLVSMTATAQ